MKIKPLLFLFALGLGSATAFAGTPQCYDICYSVYARCTGPVYDAPDPACVEQLTNCVDACDAS
jgi:hypothetical protein